MLVGRGPAVAEAGTDVEGPLPPAGEEPLVGGQAVDPRLHALDGREPAAGVDLTLGPVEAGPLAVAGSGRYGGGVGVHQPKSLTMCSNGAGLTRTSPENGWLRVRITKIWMARTAAKPPTMR